MAQHKWHKEIKAWADGAEIEFAYSVVSACPVWNTRHHQDWDDTKFIFRIKPQPQYLYVYARTGNTQVEIHRGYKEGEHAELTGRLCIGKIKLEQDDGTD